MRKVIIDCDPGCDDAIAILLAAPHLRVLGITTVAGNQPVEKVTVNALKIVELGVRMVEGSPSVRRGETPNAQVGVLLDHQRFFDLLIDTLARHP